MTDRVKQNFNRKAEHALKIKEASGRYRTATEEEIIKTALSIIDARFQKGTAICNPKDAHQFLKLELAHIEHEIFAEHAVLWLDNSHRVIALEAMFRGTIDSASVPSGDRQSRPRP